MSTLLWDIKKARGLVRWQRLLRRRDSKRTPVRMLIMIVFGLFFLASMGMASVSPLMALRNHPQEMDGFVVLVSVVAGAFVLYIQLMVIYQRVIAEDTSMLLVAPLSGRAILLFRLFESSSTTLLFGLLGLPMLGVYLWLSHAPWWGYVLSILSLWLMTWLVAALALFIMTIFIRLIRRPISRDVLGVISSIVAVGILLGTRILTHAALGTPGQVQAGALFTYWLNPAFIYLPFSWFGHSMIGFTASFGIGFAYLALSLLGVLLAVQLSFTLGAPVLHERLTQLSDVAARRPRRKGGRSAASVSRASARSASGTEAASGARAGESPRSRVGAASSGASAGGPHAASSGASGVAPRAASSGVSGVAPHAVTGVAPPGGPGAQPGVASGAVAAAAATAKRPQLSLVWEIAWKDLLRLRRTPADLANYLFPTAYLLYFITQPDKAGGMGAMFGLLPVFILILASTMGRVPISSFGTEGEQVWLYLQAPTPSNAVLWAKWLFGTLPTLVWWELLCILLTLFHAMTPALAVLLGIAGIWLIPGAVALTLPFAIHGAAFIPRLVGRRNRYVNARSSWYILVIFPYLLLQLVPLGAVALVWMPRVSMGGVIGTFIQHLQGQAWLLPVGLIVSILLAGLGTLIGRSMGLEAWRNKRIELYETGSLDGNG
ncbi:hypothetical protein JZ785_13965 [Alicyclobacillus curvatus]|nr:hypothetical protein JZ785_13965 [Alicyclobacillus curvatus]